MDWDERIASYVRLTGFPRSLFISEDGRVVGTWIMGNDYRVKSGYYAGYPAGYGRRDPGAGRRFELTPGARGRRRRVIGSGLGQAAPAHRRHLRGPAGVAGAAVDQSARAAGPTVTAGERPDFS
jgi:hypothetical protein